jgi:hypothetical protein
MKRNFIKPRTLAIASLLLVAVFSSCDNEERIVFTRNQLMVIYEHGYLKGRLNQQHNQIDANSNIQWKIDSTEMRSWLLNCH